MDHVLLSRRGQAGITSVEAETHREEAVQQCELVLGGMNHSGSCELLSAAGILGPHPRTIASAHILAEGFC